MASSADVLGEREREAIGELFGTIERDVPVRLELGPAGTPIALLSAGGREIDPCAETQALLETVAALSDRVVLEVVERDEPGAYPLLTVGDGLGYLGLPWGYELSTLVHAIAAAGRTDPGLSTHSLDRLASLDDDMTVDVYVTPT